jgi:hypothetical protein
VAQPEVKDYRVTVTPHANRRGGHAKLLKDLKAVGFRVVNDQENAVAGLIPTDKIEDLAKVKEISLRNDEQYQLSPIESKAT